MPGTLEQRVAALEAELAGLQGSEALQPNYLTVNPQGQVGATFSGHVKASGVDLPEATSAGYGVSSAIDWQDATGFIREFIQGYQNGPGGVHRLQLASGQGSVYAYLTAEVAGGAAGTSKLTTTVLDNVGPYQQKTILDSAGGSSFAFNASANGALAINGGSTAINFNGSTYGAVTVNHGLGRVPIVAIAGQVQDAVDVISFVCDTYTATQFTIKGRSTSAPGGPFNVGWIAIG